jgi:hypothetical protein
MSLYDIPPDDARRMHHAEIQIVVKTSIVMPTGAPMPFADEGAFTIVTSASSRDKTEAVDEALAKLLQALDKQTL